MLSLATLLAGCGGGGTTSSTTGGAPQGFAAIERGAYRFASCMRRHGVPDFPDPQPATHDGEQGIRQVLPPGLKGSPAFRTANKDCAGILPYSAASQSARATRQQKLGLLSFADCIRARGVSNFPDPNAQGQLTVETLAADGVNIHLPYVMNAAVACIPASHGVVTRSVIAKSERQGA